MATDAAEAFVTIVPVGEDRPAVRDPSTFVTVLTVGSTAGASEVVVRRPKGARLGLGLKFEGGSAAAEKVRRLLVQSCAEDSPAANAITPWGKLIAGDEILAIDNVPVADLTRIDCVRRLKDSDETLKLLVRHLEIKNDTENNKMDVVDSLVTTKQATNVSRPMLPPPVPPRKLGKKNSFKDKLLMSNNHNGSDSDGKKISSNDNEFLGNGNNGISSQINKLSRKSSFDSHLHRQNKEGMTCFRKGSPEEVRRLARRLSDGKVIPPEAEVYIDLLSTEWERCLALADAESDDTGSSISTVVDRLGSMTSSVDNSIPNTPIMQPKTIDIHKVLNSIENIDTNILRDITCNKFLDRTIENNSENKILESCTEALDKHDIIANKNNVAANSELSMKPNKKEIEHDKNNNSTNRKNNINKRDTKEVSQATDKIVDSEINAEKPKPMPRNTKVDRSFTEKPRTISVPKTLSENSSEALLTPTKKNCIETWLQRSEAEMNCKNMEKLEESSMPEALPRLIDFVPKSQYKECESETATLKRPTTAPPPPPAETREDGSGASLDTIGELDESSDVTENTKPTITNNESNKRKPSIERNFWEDRINKSDVEDKSLSNDESPLPTCPRQPPDGVETPSEAVEKAPELPTRLPPKLPERWSSTRKWYSYSSRTQDARSEASVKDKIAMFSNDHNTSSDRSEKFGTLPVRNSITKRKEIPSFTDNYSQGISLDRRLTKSQDNLDEMPHIYRRRSERPDIMGESETKTKTRNREEILSNASKSLLERKPLFYGSSNTLSSNSDSLLKHTVFHARSISDDNGNKASHKSNLDYLIEQRKKSMSKLRGLVIPESQAPISDLPEIKVQVPLSKSIIQKTNRSSLTPQNVSQKAKPVLINESKWKTNILPNNIPKYSPAFKRKSLQVYTPSSLSKESSTPMRTFSEKVEALNKINENNSIISRLTRSSLDLNGIERRITAQPDLIGRFSDEKKYKESQNDVRGFSNVEIKICTTTDVIDSDNDSAMSSTQSSYRSSASSPLHNLESIESDNSRISPRIQHYTTFALVKSDIPTKSLPTEKRCEEYVKRSVCRSMSSDTNISISSSAGSAATSGSQASCSSLESSVADTDKRKVSKVYNIDTINRKNILASAKCRSGRDEKVKSPVIENKFTHEPSSVSLSPQPKTTERLSTLTTSVSAISNKGENRRRNKVMTETDSDSDSEIKMRQRKTDYKNTRLKRNSSSSNKNKSNGNIETTKDENTAQIVTEKNVKEANSMVLDNIDCTNVLKEDNAKNDNNDCIKIKMEENSFIIDKSRSDLIYDNNNLLTTTSPLTNAHKDEKKDNINNEEYKIPTQTIRLKRGAGTGVGLILAGGIDCEAKDVTIHRVLADSIADRAGLKRGVKVRSINNCTMVGLTHAQSVAVLKEQRAEVVIEIENEMFNANGIGRGSKKVETKVGQDITKEITTDKDAGSVVTVTLEKAGGGTGLGFGLDGGRDSPYGDRPLTIKKLFAGGSAAQTGKIVVGAELLSAGGQSMEGFTRTQAWAALKALPTGLVTLVLKNP